MSRGSPIVPVRIPAELLAEIGQVIDGRNERARGAPWTRSEFIVLALREKLAKMERSRSGRAKAAGRRAGADQLADDQAAGDLAAGE